MTPLQRTFPEPLCDVRAQLAAFDDPANPKSAIWLSVANRKPVVMPPVSIIFFGAGQLYASLEDCYRLRASPSEETLALILGYVEPKSAIAGLPLAVQAVRGDGVVWEQLSSLDGVNEARERALAYAPQVRVMTIAECLQRRRRLLSEDDAYAARIKGRQGREGDARRIRHRQRGRSHHLRPAQQYRLQGGQQDDR